MVPCDVCGREFKNVKAMAGHHKAHTVTDTSAYREANRKRWADPVYRTKMADHLDRLGKTSLERRDPKRFAEACRQGQLERFSDPLVLAAWSEKHRGSGNPNWNPDRKQQDARSIFINECRVAFKLAKKMILQKRFDIEIPNLSYTARQLKEHIERQFQSGMSWENWGTVWHVDHIRPVSSFEPGTPPSVVNALENLRPLTIAENLSKGAKV